MKLLGNHGCNTSGYWHKQLFAGPQRHKKQGRVDKWDSRRQNLSLGKHSKKWRNNPQDGGDYFHIICLRQGL